MKKLVMTAMVGAWIFGVAIWPARAAFLDGNGLYQHCSESSASGQMFCAGYVAGVWDTASRAHLVCPAGQVMLAQVEQIVKEYLRESPEKTSDAASFLALSALMDAFPCEKAP